MTLTEFLAARLDEDEATVKDVRYIWATDFAAIASPARVLREAEAGRKILFQYQIALALLPGKYKLGYCEAYEEVLKFLAGRFSDHPDYDEAWLP